MPKLIFKIDKERDAKNFWELCNSNQIYTEDEEKKPLNTYYKNKLTNVKFDLCKQEIQNNLKDVYSSGILEVFSDSLKKAWELINDNYFNRLEKITKKDIFSQDITSYITTVGRCSYNPEDLSIIISLKRPLLQCLRTIGHELMHLQFHTFYWKDIEERIGQEKTDYLNECLTVLLNAEFLDLWFVKDEGYPDHRELRNFLFEEWKKEKDFGNLLEKGIIKLNKNCLSK